MKKIKKYTALHVLIDRFSNVPTADVLDRANTQKFLEDYVLLLDIPCAIRLNQAKCQIGQKIKSFCNQNTNKQTEAPIHDQRAIEIVERLTQTIKRRLACNKTETRSQFNLKASKNLTIYRLLICRQRTINLSTFAAHFWRKPNTLV